MIKSDTVLNRDFGSILRERMGSRTVFMKIAKNTVFVSVVDWGLNETQSISPPNGADCDFSLMEDSVNNILNTLRSRSSCFRKHWNDN